MSEQHAGNFSEHRGGAGSQGHITGGARYPK